MFVCAKTWNETQVWDQGSTTMGGYQNCKRLLWQKREKVSKTSKISNNQQQQQQTTTATATATTTTTTAAATTTAATLLLGTSIAFMSHSIRMRIIQVHIGLAI